VSLCRKGSVVKTIEFTAKIRWMAPDDFDPEKIIAFRPANRGEKILTAYGAVYESPCDCQDAPHNYRPIIDDWQWPEWLTAAAVVMLPGGNWVATEFVPRIRESNDRWIGCGSFFALRLTSFVPPPCDYWLESLMINPKLQAKEKSC